MMIFKQFNETKTRTLKARNAYFRAHAPRFIHEKKNTSFLCIWKGKRFWRYKKDYWGTLLKSLLPYNKKRGSNATSFKNHAKKWLNPYRCVCG